MKNTIVDELLAETAVTANDLKNNASGDGAEFADATNAALTDPDLDIHADGIPLEEQEASLAQLAEFYKNMEGEGGVLTENDVSFSFKSLKKKSNAFFSFLVKLS